MTANHEHTPTDYDMQEQFEAGAMVTGFAHSRNEATITWQLWLQEHDRRIEAAAKQRGAERALREAAEDWESNGIAHPDAWAMVPKWLNDRADQEGDDA